ncbi:MAG: radical SAM protein [Candidatus Eisenbacteria bacterium]|nr:radical SAM protein [Candidatus Eisenbacteria bacterium]
MPIGRTEAAVIVTYRCMSRCAMCHTWEHPTHPDEEFEPSLLQRLPNLAFCNITGGEPFMRDDIDEIIRIVAGKAKRVVISTNGYLADRIIDVAKANPTVGIRISIEGLPAANDELRGMKDGFDHGLRTLLALKRLGLRDVGFGITVSDRNAGDMLELFELADLMRVEFATAIVHNSFYFHTADNAIADPEAVASRFSSLVARLLRSRRVKNWFRAYFNQGLIDRIHGRPRPLPCTAGSDFFFLDPRAEVLPCNGMEARTGMGNLRETPFDELWSSPRAEAVREMVAGCDRNCWMIGSAGPAMRRHLGSVAWWVTRHRVRVMLEPRR